MSDPHFFPAATSLDCSEVAVISGAALPEGADPARRFTGAAALEQAGPADIAYMDNPKYTEALAATAAGLCLVSPRFAERVPAGTLALVTPTPYHAFAKILARFFPAALKPGSVFASQGVAPGAFVHATAVLEAGVTVDPGAVIGPGAEIGSGTVVASHAVIGPQVRIGRDCSIGAGCSLQATLIGNRVIIHPGVRIGQDGFGFAMSPRGHMKVPQIGRVIIQDDVEIGANTCIDRGASRDTVIGEGTKIDNLVQIGHNVVVGRHCVIVSQVGIAGSSTLEDFVVLGGQVGLAGHLTIGMGAQIAAQSGVAGDVPRGAKYGGYPAQPALSWARESAMLKSLLANRGKGKSQG
ncbi:MAG: UDP-3-O-(3-hydroxymyristoyl)glucosamine N-acyltransferase [Bosea sp. (in: a-proteobacteria)]|uniref:UDP-3-O-(3-hydroxymyristoyl)glucosamine N-acyltransferase n=1 Tax=Bosea sp. (in: a-proteobacteria) TaxID=1871050 RepID=UPI002734862D|nr:UDP-3-O-(3-hydroxymyristoyl)glucosamine N-acyltransferase [Bosea sp. (in: a-proteobacteria)]MDP3254990.1 UDP-3-O-(3-hydroxymyristoyl)glucosamine N-acyltransferase [Bosea sp. (in: a-proteobacteria)]MDP3321011.1 UDP-3-O-(3-hydroxymyristoyl)glucosamine N-acyltransferase [Bosea sp. (in: a-proteobacteria)]